MVVAFTYCDEDEARAEEMAHRYIGNYWESVMSHYEFRSDHLKTTRGYEYYGKFTEKVNEYSSEDVRDFFTGLQVWGTPEQCYGKVMDIHKRTGHDTTVCAFSYGGMPFEDAEKSMRLFASGVLPDLQRFQPTTALA